VTWYSGPSSLGACDTCGSPVSDGGQSGAYCSNPQCRHGYLGGKTVEQIDREQKERRRKTLETHEGCWSIWCEDDKPYPTGYGSGFLPTRDDAVKVANRERARGLINVNVRRVIDGEMVDVTDDLSAA
jgi:hypothetical protein